MIPPSFAIPTVDHLARAYHELARLGANAVGAKRPWPYESESREELLVICAELSRYDPRLFEIMVGYFRAEWERLDWMQLRRFVVKTPTPQVFGVIGELLQSSHPDAERRNCFRFLLYGMRPVPTQFFYTMLYTPGSHLAKRAATSRLREFETWGFLASERPITRQEDKSGAGRLTAAARRDLLRHLAQRKRSLRLGEYLSALPHRISRQQALADFKAIGSLKCRGRGRGSVWMLRPVS